MNYLDKKLAIIGLGYTGLPVAVRFEKQWNVIGFNINVGRIEELKKGSDQTLATIPEN